MERTSLHEEAANMNDRASSWNEWKTVRDACPSIPGPSTLRYHLPGDNPKYSYKKNRFSASGKENYTYHTLKASTWCCSCSQTERTMHYFSGKIPRMVPGIDYSKLL
ncbi:hypothetical protein CEXT_778681 [Caerostris extrusa]|uniref:Uncharacterized protein n=1 Tax=Caerostris extrusa TaxID=172846 RepID=A0AAV4XNX5_CAEEX|nr:hypothetical protein CEXT_778681 [Caerostris extrusa]